MPESTPEPNRAITEKLQMTEPPKCDNGHSLIRMTSAYFCPICDMLIAIKVGQAAG